MSKITEVFIDTKENVYHFDGEDCEKNLMEFLKENPKDIVSMQITEVMTKEEFERTHK